MQWVLKIGCIIMGFDVTPPSNKPIIREASSMQNDGGAGNLGYFEREGDKEKKQSQESIFSAEKEHDSFKRESDVDDLTEEFSISKLIANIIFSIKEWFRKLIS